MNADPQSLFIVHHPHPVLRQRAEPVGAVTDHVRSVAARMIELMFQAEGIGLAAPQIALPWRMFVAHVPPQSDSPVQGPLLSATDRATVYIDPIFSEPSKDLVRQEEGCLSLPDILGDILRPETVRMEWTTLEGERHAAHATGLLARCWQHENDHLDGVLILDKMTQMSRLKNRTAIRQLERNGG